jgi:hypothetical protein
MLDRMRYAARVASPDNVEARSVDAEAIASRPRVGARAGFGAVGVSDVDPARRRNGCATGSTRRHGAMDYMARHGVARGSGRARARRHPRDQRACGLLAGGGARRACGARRADRASASYALGRDYRQGARTSLQALADRIAARSALFGYRAFWIARPS